MNHPLTNTRKYLMLYIGTWIAVFAVHVLILFVTFNLPLYHALLDSLVYNGLFAILGFSIWFPIFYNERGKREIINIVLTHLLAGAITIALWYSVSKGILQALLLPNQPYESLVFHDYYWRIPLGTFFYLIIALSYYLLLFYSDLKEKIRQEAHLQQLVTEAELKTLRAQINPHFLFNSLNSINTLTITAPEKAQQMIIKLSDYMRYSLKKDKTLKVTLDEELSNIRLYLDIEKIRFGRRLSFQISVEDHLLPYPIPHMILQPLVENAVKYGVYESIDENRIVIDIYRSDTYLVCKVKNDFDPDLQPNGEGVGISNINKRLQLIYKKNNLLTTTVKDTTFETLLQIPMNI